MLRGSACKEEKRIQENEKKKKMKKKYQMLDLRLVLHRDLL